MKNMLLRSGVQFKCTFILPVIISSARGYFRILHLASYMINLKPRTHCVCFYDFSCRCFPRTGEISPMADREIIPRFYMSFLSSVPARGKISRVRVLILDKVRLAIRLIMMNKLFFLLLFFIIKLIINVCWS